MKNWLITHPNVNPYRLSTDPGLHRFFSGFLRFFPSFLIIGAQKCGTTSLYDYLIQHPAILSASRKEIGFFDRYYNMSLYWYKSHFPLIRKKLFEKQKVITGEASPNYLFDLHASKRVYEKFPDIKLIVLLRNPIDRAYSHYQMQVRKGFESLSFEDAIKSENTRLLGEKEKIIANENYYAFNYEIFSYLQRGIYVDQLERWLKVFSKKQILVLNTEEFNHNLTSTLSLIFDFLNVDDYDVKDLTKSNVGRYIPIKETTRNFLNDYFKPYNTRLYDLLNRNFEWN